MKRANCTMSDCELVNQIVCECVSSDHTHICGSNPTMCM